MNYAMASPSLAHTYGNVTCFMTEWLKGLFPKNYFKTVYVSSTIAYRNFSRFNNTTKEFIKKSKPMLIIKPRIEIDNDEGFLKETYFTTRIVDMADSNDWGNLQDYVEDDLNQRYVKFLMNRLNISFDVSIIVETQMEQINMVHYFKNRIRQGRPMFLNTCLESFVPRDIIALLAKDIAVPIKDDMGYVKPILDFLNSNACYPTTYKYKNSTGNDEFFRYHPAAIETVITGLTIDEGSRKGQISDNFQINFTVNCEFSTAGLYYYFTENKKIIDDFIPSYEEDNSNSSQMTPIFTVSNIYDIELPPGWNVYTSPMYTVEGTKSEELEFEALLNTSLIEAINYHRQHGIPELPPGWNVYTSPMYTVEGTKSEELEFEALLNTSLIEAINYHRQHGIPLSVFLSATVMKNNKVMSEENGEYKIDWDRLVITTYNCNPSSTYRFILNVNTQYINELIKHLLNLDEER